MPFRDDARRAACCYRWGMAEYSNFPISTRTERRYKRHRVDCRLRMHVFVDEDCSTLVQGRGLELGRGGMGAELSSQLRPGETVWLESSLAFRAYATVRYTNGFYHGFEFAMLRQSDRTRVDNLCDRYSNESVKGTA